MTEEQATIGTRVRTLVDFSGVDKGTEGVIDEDYKTGVMVAWDLPGRRLPSGYREFAMARTMRHFLTRDGFDKKTELHYLEVVQ